MYNKYNLPASARGMFLITPSTSAIQAKALRADTAGSVTFLPADSSTSVTLNVSAGEVITVEVIRVTAATAVIHGLV